MRVEALDAALQLQPGHGFAEVMVRGGLYWLARGDVSAIMEGWHMEQGEEWVREKVRVLTEAWKREDETLQA